MLITDCVTCSLCPRPGIVSAPGSPNRPSRRLSDIRMQNCEAQGKGRAKGRPRKVTQWSFIDGGWWMVDILSLMLYTKFGCHHHHHPPSRKSLNLQD